MSLFGSGDVAALRTERLLLTSAYVDAGSMTDAYLLAKLQAAEADAARRLKVFFEPTWVFAGDPTEAELSAINSDPYIIDPPFDYDPAMFQIERYGMILTRRKPVISVQSLTFVYPVPIVSRFTVPAEWIRLDRRAGQIQLVPSLMPSGTTIALFLMQSVGGGMQVPQMIHARYRAGLTDVANQYPDLMDVIQRMAVLKILNDAFVPQSGSISADGLSQSNSLDILKYQEGIDKALAVLFDSIHGVVFTVV